MLRILRLSAITVALQTIAVSPSFSQYGACCFDLGECLVMTEEECYEFGGFYFVPDNLCDPDPCLPAACCLADGSCYAMTEAHCLDSGGIWVPESDCHPDPCPQVGTCCYEDGLCELRTYWSCVLTERTYLWMPGEMCAPNPCPNCFCIGCCLPDGSCTTTSPDECVEFGGEYFGNWIDCTPNPCDYPPGACCFETGQCVVLAEVECWEGPGAYAWFGDRTCDPDPCPTSSVPESSLIEWTTWGSVKATYR